MADYVFFCFFVFFTSAQNKFDFRPVSAGRSHLLYNRSSCPALVCLRVLTLVAPPVFDDNGPPAACLLLGLGHALTSLIVRVICSVDCHLLLNHPETWQLLGSTGGGRTESKDSDLTEHDIDFSGKVVWVCTCWTFSSPITWHLSGILHYFPPHVSVRRNSRSDELFLNFSHISNSGFSRPAQSGSPGFLLAFKKRPTARRSQQGDFHTAAGERRHFKILKLVQKLS